MGTLDERLSGGLVDIGDVHVKGNRQAEAPPPIVPIVTLVLTVEPSTLTLLRRATTARALWKHAHTPPRTTPPDWSRLRRLSHLHRGLEIEIEKTVTAAYVAFAATHRCRLRCVEPLHQFCDHGLLPSFNLRVCYQMCTCSQPLDRRRSSRAPSSRRPAYWLVLMAARNWDAEVIEVPSVTVVVDVTEVGSICR